MGIILSIVCWQCFGSKQLISNMLLINRSHQYADVQASSKNGANSILWNSDEGDWAEGDLYWHRHPASQVQSSCFCYLCCFGAIVVAVVVDLCRSEYQVTSMFTGKSASRRRGRTAGRREPKHQHHNITSLEICQNILSASSRILCMSKHLWIQRFEPREVIVQRCEPTVKHLHSAFTFWKRKTIIRHDHQCDFMHQ